MNPETARKLIVVGFLVGMGFITWNEFQPSSGNVGLPRPSRYALGSIVFLMLGIAAMADPIAPMAGLMAIGLDIAIYYNIQANQSAQQQPPPPTGVTTT